MRPRQMPEFPRWAGKVPALLKDKPFRAVRALVEMVQNCCETYAKERPYRPREVRMMSEPSRRQVMIDPSRRQVEERPFRAA
jgi:hypothetical protein